MLGVGWWLNWRLIIKKKIVFLSADYIDSGCVLLHHYIFQRQFFFIIYLLLSPPFITFPITHHDEMELMDLNEAKKKISKRKRLTDREWKMRTGWSETDNVPLAGVLYVYVFGYVKWIDWLNAHLKTSYFVKSERF